MRKLEFFELDLLHGMVVARIERLRKLHSGHVNMGQRIRAFEVIQRTLQEMMDDAADEIGKG